MNEKEMTKPSFLTGAMKPTDWLLPIALVWLVRFSTALTDTAINFTIPFETSTAPPKDSICICSINVSQGRRCLDCRQYQLDSPDLVFLSSRNILLRAPVCSGVTSIRAEQPVRIHQLRPGRLLQMTGLISIRLRQVDLRFSFHPDALRGLKNLTDLEIIGPHSLDRLEAHSFQHTPRLRRLVLRDNGIKYIDRFAFCEAENLEYLDLSRNRIVAYSCDWFPGLSALKFLNVTLLTGTEVFASVGTKPPSCLFCPLTGLAILSFNDINYAGPSIQLLRHAIIKHYRLQLLEPLLYNVTGLRDPQTCGGLDGEAAIAWQQCQRWRDGKPVVAQYVTMGPSTAAVSSTASPAEEVSDSNGVIQSPNEYFNNSSSRQIPDTSSGDGLQVFLSSQLFLVVLVVCIVLVALSLIICCIACCFARSRRHRGARYSVKAANEAAAAAAAAGNGKAANGRANA